MSGEATSYAADRCCARDAHTHRAAAETVPRPLARRLLRWIEIYQAAFSGRPSPCRFFPSCSEYAREAIMLHGSRRGTWLTAKRLLRCRPLGPSGFDPVPVPEKVS